MSVTRFLFSTRAFTRPAARSQVLAPCSQFSTSPYSRDLVGKVQEAADAVSKKAGQSASKGIETLESAKDRVMSATGTASSQAKNVASDAQNEMGKTKESAKSMAKDAQKKATN
ncbi:uncharacterized protein MELLADRAFT_72502 [Melampsora larici-populina 98AG31]|uniref:Uncharacterized protein n=1 Tax=Melampsora larici-populina (strain 98AG31 / pathotype 3-4-7) TaxID=747676 RepID=F4RUU0_MELLP|nr:uncharacterized protein MELLADRAFT_72502 [Melampsora larici-populina 98AG31]EGG03755.1 hypothetical protein MELLADRAFT_72502 [Melampsora larici-populina 98AG31]